MASLNKIQVIGNLGKAPELRYTAEGEPVCNLSIAASDKWTAKDGTKKEETTWFRVSFWGKLAEVCAQYLQKGSQCYVEGSIRTRKYTDKDGVLRDTWEVRGEKMVMLGRKEEGDGQARAAAPAASGKTFGQLAADKAAERAAEPAQQHLPGSGDASEPSTLSDADLPF